MSISYYDTIFGNVSKNVGTATGSVRVFALYDKFALKCRSMISTREAVVTSLSDMTEAQLKQVVDYLEYLKFRERRDDLLSFDDTEIETLYAEFADEDRELAEAGLPEYALHLGSEDAVQ